MPALLIAALLFAALLGSYGLAAPAPTLAAVKAAVQKVIDEQAQLYNASFQVGFKHATVGSFGVVAGVGDHLSGALLSVDDMVPLGSVTKSYTAAFIVKLAEQGTIDLDTAAHVYADPVLKSLSGQTLQELWAGDATINTVTVRHLLHMQAGLHDYDDQALQDFTIAHPHEDKTPLQLLQEVNKTFLCAPGACAAYTSVGYALLGFVLVGADPTIPTWAQLDQRGFMTPAQKRAWNRTAFPGMGSCTDYDVSPQWSTMVGGNAPDGTDTATFFDYRPYSCLNGWTCGNIAARASDVAGFYHALLTGDIVTNAEKLAEMTKFSPFTTGWGAGIPCEWKHGKG